jgi:hypothetical protein
MGLNSIKIKIKKLKKKWTSFWAIAEGLGFKV